MTKLELLYALKSKKFDQLCALVARELGYDELSILTVEDRIRVEDQATQHVELWEETVEMKTNFTIRPITPLRRLLAKYHPKPTPRVTVIAAWLEGEDRWEP